jgi:hypothetical protein
MYRGLVREPRAAGQLRRLAQERRRQLESVRRPDVPDLRIDRVVVCPSGVYVVSQAGPGVAGLPHDVADTRRSSEAAVAVEGVLPQRYRATVRPVLCREDLGEVAEDVRGVLVTTSATLEHVMAYSPVVLSTSEVAGVGTRLDEVLEPFPIEPRPSRGRLWRRLLVATTAAAAAAGAAVAVRLDAVPAWPW